LASPSGAWSAPAAISAVIPWDATASTRNIAASAQVAFDGAGDALATWRVGTGPFANRFTGGAWAGPVTLVANPGDNTDGSAIAPIAFDPAGNATTAWWGHATLQAAQLNASTGTSSAPVDLASPGSSVDVAFVPGPCGGPLVAFGSGEIDVIGQH
jgi:hypothetical protein